MSFLSIVLINPKTGPDAVVLLDEVEKAHPNILTITLQLFDEGRITDGKGNTVICKGAVFIMTSNLAQREIADEADFLRNESSDGDHSDTYDDVDYPEEPTLGVSTVIRPDSKNYDKDAERKKAERQIALSRQFIEYTIYPLLHSHFRRDEFLGRINEILIFLPFSENEIDELIYRELSKWADKTKSRHGITITWEPEVIEVLAYGYNVRYGAGSIKYEVERKVVNSLAKAYEDDEVSIDETVHFVVKQSKDKKKRTCKLEVCKKG